MFHIGNTLCKKPKPMLFIKATTRQALTPQKMLTSLELATQQASLTYTSLIQAMVTSLKSDKHFRIFWAKITRSRWNIFVFMNPGGYRWEEIANIEGTLRWKLKFNNCKPHYIMTMIYEYEPSLKSLSLYVEVLSR